jgi:hypothetical protein
MESNRLYRYLSTSIESLDKRLEKTSMPTIPAGLGRELLKMFPEPSYSDPYTVDYDAAVRRGIIRVIDMINSIEDSQVTRAALPTMRA